MSQQTVGHSEEKSSWVSGLAALIVVAALVLYYTLADQSLWLRLAVLFGGIAAAVLIVAISPDGRRFIAYAKDSWYEVKKVVWPSRKETEPDDSSRIWFCSDHVPVSMACRQID